MLPLNIKAAFSSVPLAGIEPASIASKAIVLSVRREGRYNLRARDRNRTGISSVGSWHSTIELHARSVINQPRK